MITRSVQIFCVRFQRPVWFAVVFALLLSGCEFFYEKPVRLAIEYVEKRVMAESDKFHELIASHNIRERLVLEYLHARRQQGATLGISLVKSEHDDSDHRTVYIAVNEHGRFGRRALARFQLRLERPSEKFNKRPWSVSSFALLE